MLKAIRHLDYVVLICEDLARMKRFYRETLGFELHKEILGGNWIELKVGSVLLALRPRWAHEGEHHAGYSAVQLAFRVAPGEVDACFLELKAKGVEVTDEPKNQEWGHRTLFFRDPENNLLEIYADL